MFGIIETLLDQPLAHLHERQRKGHRGKDDKVTDPRQKPGVDPAGRDGTGEIDQTGEREKGGRGLGPTGEIFNGEEGPAEQEHRRDEQKDRQVEEFNAGNHCGADHARRAEGESSQQRERQQQKPLGIANQAKKLITTIMIAVAMTAFVAPQRISPVMISSTVSGVAIIASKVF